MARYHDASRNLHRMEEELLAAEYDEDYIEEDFDDEEYEYEEEWEEEDQWEEQEEEVDDLYYRRRPRRQPGFQRGSYEAFDEDAAVAPRQDRRIGKLLLLALLEILAIAAVIRWWIQWL